MHSFLEKIKNSTNRQTVPMNNSSAYPLYCYRNCDQLTFADHKQD